MQDVNVFNPSSDVFMVTQYKQGFIIYVNLIHYSYLADNKIWHGSNLGEEFILTCS